MSVAFGFSAGDFIAALKIVREVVDALRESGESSAECRQLLSSLFDLETALIHVRRLELDDSQADQLNALKHAALQCRTTIDAFMDKIQKYQPHLHLAGSGKGSLLKQSWYKIKWALCRKEDLQKFKADLNGHTEAINLLMAAIQIKQLTIEAKTQHERHLSLKGIVQDCFAKTMQKLGTISDLVATSISNSKKLIEITIQTAQADCRIFGIVLDIQDMLRKNIAPQILRSQPVYFIDALGIPAPFYLEFIRSSEAFTAVLRSNMRGNDTAVERIDRGEFAVSDITSKMDIDLSRPWHMCFRPGQQVDMSIIMNEEGTSSSTCPRCKTSCSGETDAEISCWGCGLTFRRFTEIRDSDKTSADAMTRVRKFTSRSSESQVSEAHVAKGPSQKRKREDDIAQELIMYRKVRLRTQNLHNYHSGPGLLATAEVESPTGIMSQSITQRKGEDEHKVRARGRWDARHYDIIRCVCIYDDNDGHVVVCRNCNTWQHVECYYHDKAIPERHFCTDCLPQDLDGEEASARQRRTREQSNSDSAPDADLTSGSQSSQRNRDASESEQSKWQEDSEDSEDLEDLEDLEVLKAWEAWEAWEASEDSGSSDANSVDDEDRMRVYGQAASETIKPDAGQAYNSRYGSGFRKFLAQHRGPRPPKPRA